MNINHSCIRHEVRWPLKVGSHNRADLKPTRKKFGRNNRKGFNCAVVFGIHTPFISKAELLGKRTKLGRVELAFTEVEVDLLSVRQGHETTLGIVNDGLERFEAVAHGVLIH